MRRHLLINSHIHQHSLSLHCSCWEEFSGGRDRIENHPDRSGRSMPVPFFMSSNRKPWNPHVLCDQQVYRLVIMGAGWYNEPLSCQSVTELATQVIILYITTLINQTGNVLIEIHRFYSFVHLLCTDHVLRYNSGFSWITLAFNTEPNKEGIWNEQFLKSSPFISNCPHCTVPPSQIFLRFSPLCLISHFSPSLILSLLVPCHSPLCHSFGPSLFVTSAFDPSPSLSPSLPHFLGWLLCSVHIEAFCSPSLAPLSLCTAVAGPWMQNNVFCCIRLLIFLIILSCSIVGCDTFFAVKCTAYERASEWVCALSLSFIL